MGGVGDYVVWAVLQVGFFGGGWNCVDDEGEAQGAGEREEEMIGGGEVSLRTTCHELADYDYGDTSGDQSSNCSFRPIRLLERSNEQGWLFLGLCEREMSHTRLVYSTLPCRTGTPRILEIPERF